MRKISLNGRRNIFGFSPSSNARIDGRFFNFSMSSRAQVWVETVIYTLIGLGIIGILLAASKPKIEEMKDKIIIEQTITSLNDISSKIYDVQISPGNKRILNLKITKGRFYVNASSDEIGWILESNYKYSEIGRVVSLGNLNILTTESSPYLIKISMKYSINLTYSGQDTYFEVEGSPSPYVLSVENMGMPDGRLTNVDLVVN